MVESKKRSIILSFELKMAGLISAVLSEDLSFVKDENIEDISNKITTIVRRNFKVEEIKNNVQAGHRAVQSYANTRTSGSEQYYTNSEVVDLCLSEVKKVVEIKDHKIIEPAGGTGEFVEGFIRCGVPPENITSYDIEPRHSMVKKGDYLEQPIPYEEGNISITNPPFGRSSSLAKKFFNKDAESCDYICYLVPKSWRKWTVQNSLNLHFHLISDIDLPKNCFYLPDGTSSDKDVLNTVFQIWEKRDYMREKVSVPDHGLIKKVIAKDVDGLKFIKDANFSIVTFGHSCGLCKEVEETFTPYKTTTMYLKIEDHPSGIKSEEIKEALRKINLSKYYNNVSYVQALSIQEINYELNEYFSM